MRQAEREGAADGRGPAPTASALSIRDVTVQFRTRRHQVVALDGVNLKVRPGEFVSIVGPSGCGKSTLLKVAAGLVQPTVGEVSLLGRPVTGPRNDIGFVFQRAALLEWRSVRRNILLQAEIRGLPAGWAKDRASQLIEMTGLRGFEDALPHELSGGMQQRVSLCRALLHEPPVLLMDEPFGALDALTREQLNVELRRIWQETGTTIVLVTHSIAEAVYLSNRVAVMSPRPGRVLEEVGIERLDQSGYAQATASPAFATATTRIRKLLGTTGSEEANE